jgi:3,4-dihydroxy 2-butanone 4-phosphate synthase/GTP cyclohydrolase II
LPHRLTIESAVMERIHRALDEIRAGRMVILVDDEDRENEGDLCMAADRVTPEAINFMAKFGRGLICLTLEEEQVARLELPMMTAPGRHGPPLGTAFTVSIEARTGVTTGISAADRAHTVRVAIAPDARPSDVVTPGHVFPLRARRGGVLVRAGQTEGSVDLARLAGCGLPA